MEPEDELEQKELEEKREKQRLVVEKVEETERLASEKVEAAEDLLSDLVDEIAAKNKTAIECALNLITTPMHDSPSSSGSETVDQPHAQTQPFRMSKEALAFKLAEAEFCRAQIRAAHVEAQLSMAKAALERARMERIEEKNKYMLLTIEDAPEEQLGDLDPLEKALQGIKGNSIREVNLKMEGLDDASILSVLEALEDNTSVELVYLDANELEYASFAQLNNLFLQNSVITHLSLNFIALGESGLKIISDGLAFNKTLVELSLVGSELYESGMKDLAASLKKNSSLTSLVVSENSISDLGCEYVKDMASNNTTIEYLDISYNQITAQGALHIAEMLAQNPYLKVLHLQGNSINDNGCATIAASLPTGKLEELDLSNCAVDTFGLTTLCNAVKQNQSLRTLNLRQNNINVQSKIAFQELKILKGNRLDIQWRTKKSKEEPPLSEDDLQYIIKYCTTEKLLEWCHAGKNLEPTADIEKVLISCNYSEKDARKLWSMIFPLSESFNKMFEIFNNALERTVKKGEENLEDCELVKLIMKNTSKLESYLQPHMKKLRVSHLQIFRLLRILCLVQNDTIRDSLVLHSQFPEYTTTIFFHFHNHTIFQIEYFLFIEQLLTAPPVPYKLVKKVLINAKLLENIIQHHKVERLKPIPQRKGNFGFLTKLSNKIVEASANDAKVQEIVDMNKDWRRFVEGPLVITNKVEYVPEGIKPKRNPGDSAIKADDLGPNQSDESDADDG